MTGARRAPRADGAVRTERGRQPLTPNPATDLFMNSGDVLSVDLHDTAAGFQVVIHDLTTGQSGSMTASVANGFAQVNYQPTATTCSESPYAYHPMYATSSEHTRVPWAAHSYNVAFSDEIGHFEYCNLADEATGNCLDTNEPGGLDADDTGCFNADDSLFVLIAGCNLFPTGGDIDFDGVPYQPVWPGTNPNRGQDKKYHPSSVLFTSPTSDGHNFERVAFEARTRASLWAARFLPLQLVEPCAPLEGEPGPAPTRASTHVRYERRARHRAASPDSHRADPGRRRRPGPPGVPCLGSHRLPL